MVILAGGGAEYHGIQNTGRPTSQQLLKFSEWQPGSGNLYPTHMARLPPGSAITEYRVGRAYGLLTKMVFYEAKYRLPDGTHQVAHAFGPEPLISHRKDVLYFSMIGGPILSVSFFVFAARYRRPSVPDNVVSNETSLNSDPTA